MNKVKENVQIFFEENLPQFELLEVRKASEHPDDWYLYHVIGRYKNDPDKFACWTCWNETTQSLNFGHYWLESIEEVESILREV